MLTHVIYPYDSQTSPVLFRAHLEPLLLLRIRNHMKLTNPLFLTVHSNSRFPDTLCSLIPYTIVELVFHGLQLLKYLNSQ